MTKKESIPVRSEDEEQEFLFRWAALNERIHPELSMLYAVPNGGFRHIQTATRLKATGVKAGVPDVCLPVPRGAYHGLYIEMKRSKGGKVSAYQQRWIIALRKFGYHAVVAQGADEAIKVIIAYLKGGD